MNTSAVSMPMLNKQTRIAIGVRFTDTMLYIALADGREIGVPLTRFSWLAQATPAQKNKWHIEPRGFAVYWDDLDDGIEIDHLLA
jgi:hypothetical protein